MNAPTGRNARVRVSDRAMSASERPKSFAMAVRVITTRKKSNASSVQPRNPATTAARWSPRAGPVTAARSGRARTAPPGRSGSTAGHPSSSRSAPARACRSRCGGSLGPAARRTVELPHRERQARAGALRDELGCPAVEPDRPGGAVRARPDRAAVTGPARGDQRAAVVAGFLGWTLDAFDFFLVVMTLTAIAKDFGRSDADIALSLTLTLAFRPVGAFIFGLIADRYGRKIPLMADLVFYSVIEVLSGLAQSYTTFLVLRALFGIGMGAEWGVGASLVLEKVSPRYRGVISGLLQQGYALGYLLAALCYRTLFAHFGWRPLFFIGGLPALLALFVRARVKESEVWRETRHESWSGLGNALWANLPLFAYITVLMWMMNMVSHGTQDMYPTFLQRHWGFTAQQRGDITIISTEIYT